MFHFLQNKLENLDENDGDVDVNLDADAVQAQNELYKSFEEQGVNGADSQQRDADESFENLPHRRCRSTPRLVFAA